MTFWYSEEEDQKTRDALLRYYSSECTVHGSYIITLGIGFFGFLQVVTFIQRNVVYPDVILSLIVSTFASIGVYLVVRTIFWGTIASYVLHVREISPEEVEIDSKLD